LELLKKKGHQRVAQLRSVDNSQFDSLARLGGLYRYGAPKGAIMAKRKKGSKVQKRAKLRRGNSAKRGKAAKVAKSAKATKRTVARAKPKRAPKKVARQMKRPATPAVETVAVEVIEQPAPGVITVTEIEETVTREESPSPG
jgi:hypothetical protein